MNPHRQSCHSCQPTQWVQPAAQPVVCPPQYRVQDSFLPRMQPVIHPIVNVNREHIVNVPQHFWTETNRNVVVNPPQQAFPMQQGGFPAGGFPAGGFPTGGFQQPFPTGGFQQPMQQQFFPGQFR